MYMCTCTCMCNNTHTHKGSIISDLCSLARCGSWLPAYIHTSATFTNVVFGSNTGVHVSLSLLCMCITCIQTSCWQRLTEIHIMCHTYMYNVCPPQQHCVTTRTCRCTRKLMHKAHNTMYYGLLALMRAYC